MPSKHNRGIRQAAAKGYIVNAKGFVVSPSGNTLSCKPKNNGVRGTYRRFGVRVDKISRSLAVHKLVAFLKFGEAAFAEGIVVRHKNGDSLDNTLSNILIGTRSQNMMDIPREARVARAGRAARKLSDNRVKELRTDRANGATYKKLMAKYGLAKSTISYIVNSKTCVLVA